MIADCGVCIYLRPVCWGSWLALLGCWCWSFQPLHNATGLTKKRIVAHGFAQKYVWVPIPREYCIVLHRFQGILIIFNMFFPDKATWFLLCLCSMSTLWGQILTKSMDLGISFNPIFRSPYWNKTHSVLPLTSSFFVARSHKKSHIFLHWNLTWVAMYGCVAKTLVPQWTSK